MILIMTSNILFFHSTLSLYLIAKAVDGVFWLRHQDMLLMVNIMMNVIDDETAGMIAHTEQKRELNVQIISSAANDDGDDA
jgi:hypothetical protein